MNNNKRSFFVLSMVDGSIVLTKKAAVEKLAANEVKVQAAVVAAFGWQQGKLTGENAKSNYKSFLEIKQQKEAAAQAAAEQKAAEKAAKFESKKTAAEYTIFNGKKALVGYDEDGKKLFIVNTAIEQNEEGESGFYAYKEGRTQRPRFHAMAEILNGQVLVDKVAAIENAKEAAISSLFEEVAA